MSHTTGREETKIVSPTGDVKGGGEGMGGGREDVEEIEYQLGINTNQQKKCPDPQSTARDIGGGELGLDDDPLWLELSEEMSGIFTARPHSTFGHHFKFGLLSTKA